MSASTCTFCLCTCSQFTQDCNETPTADDTDIRLFPIRMPDGVSGLSVGTLT